MNGDYNEKEYDEDEAFFYVILTGSFKVSSLRFNKTKKKDQKAAQDLLDISVAGPGISTF